MRFGELIRDISRGDDLRYFWFLYRMRQKAKRTALKRVLTFFMSRSAHRHGGYIGPGAVFADEPLLPHGLHGVFVSRYAVIGRGCRIYQNVTIGEVNGCAPTIGDGCLIGAGATLVGNIKIGDGAKIGAGAVVGIDIPSGCTVVSPHPRVILRDVGGDDL